MIGTNKVNTVNRDIETDQLFRDAEIRAERLVALLRMAIALGLGLSFVAVVWPSADQATPVLIRQWIFAGGSMAAYFLLGLGLGLGLGSWLANWRRLYRPWMAWPVASADCLFVLGGVWLGLINVGAPGDVIFIFPSVWLTPLVLTFGVAV